jgi:hypothetical protein
MKTGSFVLVMVIGWILSFSCNGSSRSSGVNMRPAEGDSLQLSDIEYTDREHDFGKIKEGEKVSCRFEFKNTGNHHLIVKQVKTYCGCTSVVKYTRKPVPSGETGFVEVAFDSERQSGKQTRHVAVATNTEQENHILTIKCEVEPKINK